jgi:hypothetical protein
MSYKGIEFLCEGVNDELLNSVPSASENFLEIQGELSHLEK